jgi:hypothetical protein
MNEVEEMSDIDGVPQPQKKSQNMIPTVIAIIIIAVAVVVAGYFVYQNSLQPNIQVIDANVNQVTHPTTTTWLDLGRVSNQGSFNDPSVDLGGDYYLVFDNTFSWFTDKFVNLSYTTHWPDYTWTSFWVVAGQFETVKIQVNEGQQLGGDFWVTGGGNDVDFSIIADTCTEKVSFAFSLINAGSSDGFADVIFTKDGTTVWSNKYFVPMGSTLPINGSVTIKDCDNHAFNIAVQRQYKP